MTIRDLCEPEICGLQAILPDIIKNAAPLPANVLKKLLTIINDEQESRRERAKFGDWVKSSAEQIKKEQPTDEIKVGDRVNTPYGLLIVDMIAGCIIFGHYENGDAGIWTKEGLSKHKPADHNDNTITIPVKADLDDTYWDAYKAELASKIAVAYAEKGRFAPDEIGEFAVRVADDVVDNLKKQSE